MSDEELRELEHLEAAGMLDARGRARLAAIRARMSPPEPRADVAMVQSWHEYLERGRRIYGDQFHPPPSNSKWVPFYESQERVAINWGGMIVTGTVSTTRGWSPSFVIMRTGRSLGSSVLVNEGDEILAVKRHGDRYYRDGRGERVSVRWTDLDLS